MNAPPVRDPVVKGRAPLKLFGERPGPRLPNGQGLPPECRCAVCDSSGSSVDARGLSFVRSSDTLRTSTAHCPNALWIERLTALVEVSGLFELGADLAQTEALASLRVGQI
jgi:hypothetical protein